MHPSERAGWPRGAPIATRSTRSPSPFEGRRGPHRSASRCRGRPIELHEAGAEGCLWPDPGSQGRPPDGSGLRRESITRTAALARRSARLAQARRRVNYPVAGQRRRTGTFIPRRWHTTGTFIPRPWHTTGTFLPRRRQNACDGVRTPVVSFAAPTEYHRAAPPGLVRSARFSHICIHEPPRPTHRGALPSGRDFRRDWVLPTSY